MRIVGLRIAAPAARMLQEILEDGGHAATAARIAEAIELRVTTEAPLTAEDHEAILLALGDRCPASLARLRRELLEEQRRRRRFPA
ncbi:MAG TPA: hypothetical protein VFI83_01980 [Gaiella sp.]|jgi:hypothetical protein|nr:hypothetical protein [Gaiella sp.]